jgi:hypothetical protein
MANLITPEATVAAASLFVARAPKENPAGKKAFYLRLLFTPEAMQTSHWKAIEARVMELGKETFGNKFAAMLKERGIRSPFRTDVQTKGYPEEYAAFVNMSSGEAFQPKVITADGRAITDPTKVYPGCVVRVDQRAGIRRSRQDLLTGHQHRPSQRAVCA